MGEPWVLPWGRYISILEVATGAMITDSANSAFWRRLRGDFESLQPGQFSLLWSSHLPMNQKGERLQSQWSWWRFPDEGQRARLCAIALRGARALGYDSAEAWFDKLRETDFVTFKLSGQCLAGCGKTP